MCRLQLLFSFSFGPVTANCQDEAVQEVEGGGTTTLDGNGRIRGRSLSFVGHAAHRSHRHLHDYDVYQS